MIAEALSLRFEPVIDKMSRASLSSISYSIEPPFYGFFLSFINPSFCAFYSLGVGHTNGTPGTVSISRVMGAACGVGSGRSLSWLFLVWRSPQIHHPLFVSCFIDRSFCDFVFRRKP